ncbi:NUDIX domain-containing protein [Burkholderia sp. b14]|nr:NUDIX domain-containing protein [Burkholderia sp. b14]
MDTQLWAPHVTVAAIVEHGQRFLLVEEHTPHGLRLNQPAGHLEPGETLLEAVVRETLEETGQVFAPQALVGVYVAQFERGHGVPATYVRFTYCGTASPAQARPRYPAHALAERRRGARTSVAPPYAARVALYRGLPGGTPLSARVRAILPGRTALNSVPRPALSNPTGARAAWRPRRPNWQR